MKNSDAQILITGVYRTGSEYITHYLNQYTDISASMYKINLLRFVENRSMKTLLNYEIENILSQINKRTTLRYGTEIKLDSIQDAIKNKKELNVYDLYDIIMSNMYLEGTNQTIWAEKNQLLWREIPEFVESMNNGKAILILRDPRSILASFKYYTNAPSPLYLEAIFNAFDCMRHASTYQKSSISNKVYVLKYEDFVVNPLIEIHKLKNHLNLEQISVNKSRERSWFDPYGARWHSNSSFEENVPKIFETHDAIHRWKNNLSDNEIKMTEFICSNEMEKFNYQKNFEDVSFKELEKYIDLFEDGSYKEAILGHFKHWVVNYEGLQKFPLDPLDPNTWDYPLG